MQQREYQIKVHSMVRFIIAFIGILLSSILLISDILPPTDNEIISTIQFVVLFFISFYLAHLIGMGKVKVVFSEEGFTHIWERRFILSWEKNFKIPWNIVDNYVFQKDRTFDSFIINLTNDTRYKVNRFTALPIKDDFYLLVKEFPRFSNEFKNGVNSEYETKPVKEGESIYASKYFKWAFYFMSAGFITLLLTSVLNPDSGISWSSLGVIGSGLMFYGIMIKGQNKTNANKS